MNTETPANAGESGGRQVRERHDEAEGDEQYPDNLVGRGRPLSREVRKDDPALLNQLEEQPHQANRPVDDRCDDHDEQQFRQVADDGAAGDPNRTDHIVEQRRGHRTRPGKQPEHIGQVEVERQHDQHEASDADGALDGATDAIRGDDFRLLQA